MSSLPGIATNLGENKDPSASTVKSVTASGNIQVTDGDLKYIREQGGNNAPVAYQEASGTPVETHSPLGYDVGPVTTVFLNLSKMVGTGAWSLNLEILLCANQCPEYSRRVCWVCFDQSQMN